VSLPYIASYSYGYKNSSSKKTKQNENEPGGEGRSGGHKGMDAILFVANN
jgi:hypothetical protein